MPDNVKKIPPYLQLKEKLKNRIVSGDWKGIEKLPPERIIAEETRLSRLTVNKALKELVREGLLTSQRGKGHFLARKGARRTGNVAISIYSSNDLKVYSVIEMIHGIQTILKQHDLNASFHLIGSDPDTIPFDNIDGVINLATELSPKDIIPMAFRTHTVTLSLYFFDGLPYIYIDILAGCFKAAKYLLDCGHTKIWLVLNKEEPLKQDYIKGFALAHHIAGCEFSMANVQMIDSENDIKAELAKLLRGRDSDLTGLVCEDDSIAAEMIQAAKEMGLSVPDNISVIGIGDLPISKLIDPSLTTIDYPYESIGQTLAGMLLGLLEDEQTIEPRIVVPDLIVRGTVRKLT